MEQDSGRPIPFLDGRIEHISVRKVRLLTRNVLRDLDHPILIHGAEASPVAVLVPYAQYMTFQRCWLEQLGPMLDKMGLGE